MKFLKIFVKKYIPHKFDEIFKTIKKDLKNYVAYTYNIKRYNVLNDSPTPVSKFGCTREDFHNYLKGVLEDLEVEEIDKENYQNMINRIERGVFMPKQVNSDNRVIPYQLYWHELNKILDNASNHYPFLTRCKNDDISAKEKILSIFEFRVPYFVGPLNSKSPYSWFKRKADGQIFPWNFNDIVDQDLSEQEFINKMTNSCTYLPGQDVLPKNSLLYVKFNVLNEINNIKINGVEISPKVKKEIYNQFLEFKKVSPKRIKEFLKYNGHIDDLDEISGIDITIKSSLKPLHDFKQLLNNGVLTKMQVEKIIERSTFTENKMRFKKWLKKEFEFLPEDDINYISKLKYNDFGRLSRKFLDGIIVTNKISGHSDTVIGWLWNSNNNLNQLLSDKFSLAETIAEIKKEYYHSNPSSFSQKLDDMYISNAVKRPIIRTFDIINDIEKVMGKPPKKIFIEMARGEKADKKGKRTKTRKQQIEEVYKTATEDVRQLKKELEDMGDKADTMLQKNTLFLYYMQFGRCMYTGREIDISNLKDGTFNEDHIYPQSFIKDDSLLNNIVLVDSKVNADKKDIYPIPSHIKEKMASFWANLKSIGAITNEKYRRLMRTTPFSDEEKWGFINRQLVETRQSTKAVATLLHEKFGDETDIVYVKAGLVSDFRHEVLKFPKSRVINDLHHAKDAYLNIVVGNVYSTKFTKNWFLQSNKNDYSVKTKTVFCYPFEKANWFGGKSIDLVRKTIEKNAIYLTRYAFCRKGGFFDQQPLKSQKGLIPRKKDLDAAIYGGYNKTTVSFYILVKYQTIKKRDIMIMPVELLESSKVLSDNDYAIIYFKKKISSITNEEVINVTFPLGMRKIKINTVLLLDGLRFCITGKSNNRLLIALHTSNIVSRDKEQYIKSIESFAEKIKNNPSLIYNKSYDKISSEENILIYDLFVEKLSSLFNTIPANPIKVLINKRDLFINSSIKEQCLVLLQIINILKTGRSIGCNLTSIKSIANAAMFTMSFSLSALSKKYKDIRIIDTSASGLFEKSTDNLLNLL